MFKVVVMEDEELIKKGLIYMVDWTSYGCIVAGEASNGVKGVELIYRIRPDIVITDIKMPMMSGIQLLADTMEVIDYEAIIISGYDEFAYAKTAINLGVTEYLLKPLELDEINKAMKKVVEKVKAKKNFQQLQYGQVQDRRHILDIEAIEGAIPISASYAKMMVNFIKGNYKEKISVSDISRKLMVSTTSLNKKFKDATTYSFNEFLNRYRIQQAVHLLLTTDKKIYEIAEATGFTDYKYFIAVFKKYVGYAPLEFVAKTVENTIYT